MSDIRDYFGADAGRLLDKKLFLFDMDGTIYEENTLFSGVLEFLDAIEAWGGRYCFITNNSSRSVEDYIGKVRRMGIRAGREHFFTSSQATMLYLKKWYPDRLVYCQGTRSLIRELEAGGIRVTEEVRDDVEVVLVGFDMELTMEKLIRTCRLLGKKEIPYIATNPDLVCPVQFGFVPDCGSMCIMLKNATGREPVFIGKPEPTMIDVVRETFGISAEETLVLGDRLYTDIASGLNAGVDTVCVLTGEATLEDIAREERKPTFVFESVEQLYRKLEAEMRLRQKRRMG